MRADVEGAIAFRQKAAMEGVKGGSPIRSIIDIQGADNTCAPAGVPQQTSCFLF
jgi:hypothetical protein